MKLQLFKNLTLIITLVFSLAVINPTAAQNELSGVENTEQYSTIDLIYMDKDLSVFTNLLALSGLNVSLAFTDNDHTLFVPTNDAFADMTVEKFAELTNPNNRANLAKFVNRHFISQKVKSYELKDKDIVSLNDSEKLNINEIGNTVSVGGATVTNADIETENGIIHIVDSALKKEDLW